VNILDAKLSNPLEGGPSFTLSNRLTRVLWNIVWRLFVSWTPASASPWRRLLLTRFGAKIGRSSDVRGSARVWYPANLHMEDHVLIAERVICYNQAPISFEAYALVSQGAHLCAGSHDIDDHHFQLVAKPITIGRRAWIAAEAFVGPGVTVGEGAVLGARGCAFRDLEPWTVYVGNPARSIKLRQKGSDPSSSR
jgi:putative colanic acid biosynthesis acetyltransferase WcaF